MFKSLSHFEFIFVHGLKVCFSFIDLHEVLPLTEKTVFFPFYVLASFVEDQLTLGVWVYFWVLYSVPLVVMPVSVPVPHLSLIHI